VPGFCIVKRIYFNHPFKSTIMRVLFPVVLVLLFACRRGPSDDQLRQQLSGKLSAVSSAVSASVANGVVTLTGECPDEACRTSSESAAKEVKGVKQVVNNITVAPPTPPAPPPVATVSGDDSIRNALTAVTKDFKTVTTSVNDGVITLTGEIKRADLTKLMERVHALKPKRVENKLQIK
jgi:hyperosmotically inducible periplasmic protein